MPELPDIEVFSHNLNSKFAGRKLQRIKIVNGDKLKDKPATIGKAIDGKKLLRVFRFGKQLRFEFEGNIMVGLHLMLTGDIFIFNKKNENKWTIVEFYFQDGSGLALTDRMRNANIKLNPENKEGIDALDKALNYRSLKEILNRKANIKNVLLDQNKILGIGNGYSDEILWETRISPFSVAEAIPDEKVKELAKNIKKVLRNAQTKIAKKYPGLIQGEIRDFMKIHTKKVETSPTGAPIKTEKRGMLKTFYTDEQVLYK
jgi:formamidopyrimidine-DNA glycosylase